MQIQRLGRVDSDFAPFVQHAGVPSVDVYYGKGTHLSQYELKDSVWFMESYATVHIEWLEITKALVQDLKGTLVYGEVDMIIQ